MIAAIIVTFNPNFERVFNLIEILSNQVNSIYVIDNCSSSKLNFENKFSNLKNINLDSNVGIAKAQNIGVDVAIKGGADHIVFFDQDSSIESNFINNLYIDFNFIESKGINIAAIGPRFIDERYKFYYPGLKLNNFGLIKKFDVSEIDAPCEASVLISSGTLVSVKALNSIGYMKEEFFIDFVDTEWCFRALSKGFKIYISKRALMEHSIGDDVIRFLSFNIPVHSAFRRYYRIRNLFFMWKMPYISKKLTLKLMFTNFCHQILLILLKKEKKEYIKYYIKSIKDGVKQGKDYNV